MNIENEKLIEFLEIKFNKRIKDITQEELESVDVISYEGYETTDSLNVFKIEDIILFKNLKDIIFKTIEFSSEDIININKYFNLNSVTFIKCSLDNVTSLELLNKVKKLSFNNCYMNDYSFLEKYNNLEKLEIMNPYTDDEIDIRYLINNKNLKELFFERCIISNEEYLKELFNLKRLIILWTSVSENFYETINNLNNLEELYINNEIDEESLVNKNLKIRKSLIDKLFID